MNISLLKIIWTLCNNFFLPCCRSFLWFGYIGSAFVVVVFWMLFPEVELEDSLKEAAQGEIMRYMSQFTEG